MICGWRLNRERVLGSWPGRGHLPRSPGCHLPASASSEPRVHGETEEGVRKQSGPKGLWSLTLSPLTSRPWKAGFFFWKMELTPLSSPGGTGDPSSSASLLLRGQKPSSPGLSVVTALGVGLAHSHLWWPRPRVSNTPRTHVPHPQQRAGERRVGPGPVSPDTQSSRPRLRAGVEGPHPILLL